MTFASPDDPYRDRKKYHRAAHMDGQGNVSALCFKRPRRINLKHAPLDYPRRGRDVHGVLASDEAAGGAEGEGGYRMSTISIIPHNAGRARLFRGDSVDLVLRDGGEEIRACLTAEQRADLVDSLLTGFGDIAVLVITRRGLREVPRGE